MAKYAIGLDFGTLSVRALLLNVDNGEETCVSVCNYPHAVMDWQLPTGERLPAGWALQDPQDYLDGMIFTIRDLMKKSGADPAEVVGIGVDFTSSTVLAVSAEGVPLCQTERFAREPHAYVKLWKHHGGEEEAEYIDQVIRRRGERWIDFYGGKVSGEWMLPKVLETLRHAPEVYRAADRFIEAADWIIWQLAGSEIRSASVLGYKAFYRHDRGFPTADFFKELDPELENFVTEKMNAPIKALGETAGYLTGEMARKLGLMAGIPVGSGIVDAHVSVLGSGIAEPGEMMIILGTSSCHLLLSEKEAGIAGVGGLVKDGILPGYFGYEAGQSCVGDHFDWFVKNCVPADYGAEAKEKGISIHQLLCEKLEGYRAGQSGLLALDWYNGVRSPLMDFDLNGLILGMNLLTKPEEIYLALIEATAYGTRLILESFEKAGVTIDSLTLGGGIPAKNPMLVQVYADVLKKEVRVCDSAQASAVGAAILGAAAADPEGDVTKWVKKLGKTGGRRFYPNSENAAAYDSLFSEYQTLCEYFGKGGNDVMKRLNRMRRRFSGQDAAEKEAKR